MNGDTSAACGCGGPDGGMTEVEHIFDCTGKRRLTWMVDTVLDELSM